MSVDVVATIHSKDRIRALCLSCICLVSDRVCISLDEVMSQLLPYNFAIVDVGGRLSGHTQVVGWQLWTAEGTIVFAS